MGIVVLKQLESHRLSTHALESIVGIDHDVMQILSPLYAYEATTRKKMGTLTMKCGLPHNSGVSKQRDSNACFFGY